MRLRRSWLKVRRTTALTSSRAVLPGISRDSRVSATTWSPRWCIRSISTRPPGPNAAHCLLTTNSRPSAPRRTPGSTALGGLTYSKSASVISSTLARSRRFHASKNSSMILARFSLMAAPYGLVLEGGRVDQAFGFELFQVRLHRHRGGAPQHLRHVVPRGVEERLARALSALDCRKELFLA